MANVHKGSYKKPRSINTVSVGLLLLLCAGVYWAYCFGPAYVANYRVKMLVKEAAAKYYKLSSLDSSLRGREGTKLMDDTRRAIVGVLGFDDPEMTVQLLINEQTKQVNVVVSYTRTIELPGLNRRRLLPMKAVGDSDYQPNDW